MEHWKKRITLFIVSQTITLTGSMVVAFAVMWHITLETSSGIMMMISVLCTFLPQIIIALFAGVWADRYNRKKLIIFSDLFTAAVTLVLAIIWLNGYGSYTLIFIVLALRSLGQGIQVPTVNAIIPQIVPKEHLTRINALMQTIMNTLNLLSPALGGVLLAAGFYTALFFDVGTAIIGVSVLAFLTIPKLEKSVEEVSGSIKEELIEGLIYVKNNDWLRFMLVFYAIGFFLVAPAAFLSPILVERVFGGEIWRLTANEIFWSGGAILGGIIIAAWGGFKNRIFAMGFAFLFFGLAFVAMGVVSNFWLFVIIIGIAGFFLPMFITAEMTFIQEKTDPNKMGRVFSIVNIIVSAVMPLGMLVFGPLADIIDVRYIMIATGGLMAILALVIISNKKFLSFDAEGRPDFKKKSSKSVADKGTENIEKPSD